MVRYPRIYGWINYTMYFMPLLGSSLDRNKWTQSESKELKRPDPRLTGSLEEFTETKQKILDGKLSYDTKGHFSIWEPGIWAMDIDIDEPIIGSLLVRAIASLTGRSLNELLIRKSINNGRLALVFKGHPCERVENGKLLFDKSKASKPSNTVIKVSEDSVRIGKKHKVVNKGFFNTSGERPAIEYHSVRHGVNASIEFNDGTNYYQFNRKFEDIPVENPERIKKRAEAALCMLAECYYKEVEDQYSLGNGDGLTGGWADQICKLTTTLIALGIDPDIEFDPEILEIYCYFCRPPKGEEEKLINNNGRNQLQESINHAVSNGAAEKIKRLSFLEKDDVKSSYRECLEKCAKTRGLFGRAARCMLEESLYFLPHANKGQDSVYMADEKEHDISSMVAERTLVELFNMRKYEITDSEGKTKEVSAFTTYKRKFKCTHIPRMGLMHLPDRKRIVWEKDGILAINTWTSQAIKYADYEHTDSTKYVELLRKLLGVVCDRSMDVQEAIDSVLGVLAAKIQKPAAKPGLWIHFDGGRGIGKGTILLIIRKLFGKEMVKLDPAENNGSALKWTEELERAMISYTDEMPENDREMRKFCIELKSMITDPYIKIKQRFCDNREAPSYNMHISAGNYSDKIPSDILTRRMSVFGSEKTGDVVSRELIKEIYDVFINGKEKKVEEAIGSLWWYLRRLPLPEWISEGTYIGVGGIPGSINSELLLDSGRDNIPDAILKAIEIYDGKIFTNKEIQEISQADSGRNVTSNSLGRAATFLYQSGGWFVIRVCNKNGIPDLPDDYNEVMYIDRNNKTLSEALKDHQNELIKKSIGRTQYASKKLTIALYGLHIESGKEANVMSLLA